ncbi:GBS Bsp-like repeat-containing protein, partial [[Clostridium] spiroforme]|nr:GBS Bsp-like repeat-containing protein [Thomasclavelia spiroformis]
HCYMDMINGGSSILSATVFAIGQPELKMTAEDLGNGKFRVDVEVSGQKAEIEKLEIPVWSEANGQDDIIWYV